MKTLFILNDPPYGTERCPNALRLTHTLLKKEPEAEITVFLVADAVVAGRRGQKTPDGYNMECMLTHPRERRPCCCAAPAWTLAA